MSGKQTIGNKNGTKKRRWESSKHSRSFILFPCGFEVLQKERIQTGKDTFDIYLVKRLKK